MAEKGLYSPFVRRIITVVLFAGISAALLGMYYLVFLPQQHEQFNQRTFRILREITTNFSQRVANYGIAYSNRFISRLFPDSPVSIQTVRSGSDTAINTAFKNSFRGDVSRINGFDISQKIAGDSIVYTIKKGSDTIHASRSFSEIMDPLISIHSNTFESVFLIKQKPDTLKGDKNAKAFDTILYRSAGPDITNINTDSLIGNKNLVTSTVVNIKIEGSDYKMFIVPFRVNVISGRTFLIAGLITEKDYRRQSQAIPVNFLFEIGFFLVLLLLALPFLKIFVLSIQENITIADVRLIIAVIFIIPFVITSFVSAIWLYKYPEKFSTEVLSSLQENVKNNFYTEIRQSISQAKTYDSLIVDVTKDSVLLNSLRKTAADSMRGIENTDLKDIFFYPQLYTNLENVHWMSANGDDIASWSFIKQPAGYFPLKDRQYFKDIFYKRGYSLPGSKDTFAILPTLSRLTGEFTVNIAIESHMALSAKRKAAVVGISTKMYSLYNTVVPPGFAYCLIDEKGEILCHSDTARNLQENLFEETSDNHWLHVAVTHKDSTLIDDIDLYERSMKMMVKPLPGLPYYLVTYYDKRGEYLFIIHILAFVFVCESIILLFVSLFSYCLMISNKKLYKLFFIPGVLYWLKPSFDKREYYIKNSVQLLVCIFLVFLFACFTSRQFYYLYMLNASLLLPLFAVTNYYIIKRAKAFKEEYGNKESPATSLFLSQNEFLKFLWAIRKVLALYVLSIMIFGFLQNVLLYDTLCTDNSHVKISIWILIFIIPIIISLIAVADARVAKDMLRKLFKKSGLVDTVKSKDREKDHPAINEENSQAAKQYNYLSHFIVSLLLSVSVISVIPAITFTGYALHEERKLHFQSFQLELAKRIQQRRIEINNKLWQTKVLQLPAVGEAFIDSLKFKKDKGLYLYSNVLDTTTFSEDTSRYNSCSPFYKLITQFLFLPPDHDEFYDNPTHNPYYSWKESFDKATFDSLSLSYKNQGDYRDSSSIVLKAGIPHFYIFKDIPENPLNYLVILALLVFILLFYRVIYSIAKRIFLVGFFDNIETKPVRKNPDDKPWLKLKYAYVKIEDLLKPVFPVNTPSTFAALRDRENEILANDKNGDEVILKLHIALISLYEKIWKDCTDVEKFTLYDFALDGFTNYKKVTVLYQLYEKGLLIKEDDNFTLMTKSFRNFLITKESSPQIEALSKEGKGSWAIMRTVFYIVVVAVAIFIFISQEEASKRLITIVTSLGALLPVILKLFDKSTFTSSGSKPGS